MNDVHTLSGAYSLDALEQDEREEFRRHIEQCQACCDEVAELRAVASLMGAAEAEAPPPGLRARVLAAADQTPQLPPITAPLPTDAAQAPEPPEPSPTVVQLEPRRRRVNRLVGAAAAAVLVVAGAVGVAQLADRNQPGGLAEPVAQVFEAPDARTATVTTANGGRLRVATSADRGEMAVDTDELPALEAGLVYQLWAIFDDQPSSVGVLDDPDGGAAMALPARGTLVAITVEPEGGSEQPTSDPIVGVDPYEV